MSQTCPLCGKTKLGESLFCSDCSQRIKGDYEVDLPEPVKKDITVVSVPDEVFEEEKDKDIVSGIDVAHDKKVKNKNIFKIPFVILGVILLLGGAFFAYDEVVRKSNLERSGWETALKLNSVGGYMAYMEAFPEGRHFEEAQASLLQLKSKEANVWEMMKTSDNVSELRGFLDANPQSPYVPLVERKLDSLSWLGALRVNTSESYSEYLNQTGRGELLGGYKTEAEKRYRMLFQSYPVETAVVDSIKVTVNGFYSVLSGTNHGDAFQYLAPVVRRFFNSGGASRERIMGELMMTRTRAMGTTISFTVDIESLQYERDANNNYLVNVPLVKSYPDGVGTEWIPGYIAHLEMDGGFQIISIHETKPYPDAP